MTGIIEVQPRPALNDFAIDAVYTPIDSLRIRNRPSAYGKILPTRLTSPAHVKRMVVLRPSGDTWLELDEPGQFVAFITGSGLDGDGIWGRLKFK